MGCKKKSLVEYRREYPDLEVKWVKKLGKEDQEILKCYRWRNRQSVLSTSTRTTGRPSGWHGSNRLSTRRSRRCSRETYMRQAILIMRQHRANESSQLYTSSKQEAQQPGLLDTVDSCFFTTSNLYPCHANIATVGSGGHAPATDQEQALGTRTWRSCRRRWEQLQCLDQA
ncbi:hypothetical protein Y1Q_0019905 [Alligator mississippiensis]|uniref:Uncharacterized protein n=1 Tax=Alligator mississippiensis TaxID=8496 RepID=A0A151MKP0_ALLMI|nr:hypothetical protein Y1Q_0019905 [Alligator mississippiensis]